MLLRTGDTIGSLRYRVPTDPEKKRRKAEALPLRTVTGGVESVKMIPAVFEVPGDGKIGPNRMDEKDVAGHLLSMGVDKHGNGRAVAEKATPADVKVYVQALRQNGKEVPAELAKIAGAPADSADEEAEDKTPKRGRRGSPKPDDE